MFVVVTFNTLSFFPRTSSIAVGILCTCESPVILQMISVLYLVENYVERLNQNIRLKQEILLKDRKMYVRIAIFTKPLFYITLQPIYIYGMIKQVKKPSKSLVCWQSSNGDKWPK